MKFHRMNANKVNPENLAALRFLTENFGCCKRLKCCDWSPHKFIKVNFSKLKESNLIFRIYFDGIHYNLCEISCQIIERKFFLSI